MGCTPQYELAGLPYLYRNTGFALVNRSLHRGAAQAHNFAVTGDGYLEGGALYFDQN